MPDPDQWVARLQAGDDEAWEEFVRTFSRFVPIVGNRLGLTPGEREEVLQDMTLTAFRSIRNLRDPSRLASWTYTIARRAAINLWKSRGQGLTLSGEEADPALLPSDAVPADEILARWDEGERLRAAVASLPTKCRRLVEALFLDQPRLSYKEVAERFGMPIGSIGPTLARCLGELRRTWKGVSN